MNRMIHTQSEPQTSFGGPLIEQKMPSQHMQQQQQTQSAQQHQNQNGAAQLMLNRIISSAYSHSHDNGFDGSILLNGGPQKFDFLPNLPAHPGHLMQNGGILGNQQPRGTATNGTTAKKKKGAGPGRRPALDSNGLPKERPFMCPKQDCQKRFCRNDHLQRHLRIHTGQRMFQCRTCLRSFSRSDHLAKHERTHSADKPYSCHTCARRFHKHEEKKKHEEKCQHKVDDSNASNQQQRQLNLMSGGQAPSHLMYQNPASSSSFGHHFNRLVDDIERFHAIAEHELDDAPI